MRKHLSGRLAVVSYHSSPLVEPGSGDAGGMTVYVREVARALAERGVATDIFTRASHDVPPIVEINPGVRVVSIDAGPRTPLPKEVLLDFVGDFVGGVRAFRSAQRVPYEVLHSHYWHSGLIAKRLALAWGIPFVHSHHTLALVKNGSLAPGDVPEPALRLSGEREVIADSDVLVASTDDEWQQLACLYGAPHDRLKTIHPGVDHAVFSPGSQEDARRELGLAPESAVVLYVGRVQPLKGLDLALGAIEQLRHAVERPLQFVVVGGDSGNAHVSEVARLRELARELEIEDLVRFEGPQDRGRLPLFLRAADVFAMCSYSESFGLAALEAQASGLPVVATAVGGLKHIVDEGRTGFLVEGRDPSVFAARLKTVLGDRELAASLSQAAVDAARSFSWDRTAGELAALYACLVEERLPEACTC